MFTLNTAVKLFIIYDPYSAHLDTDLSARVLVIHNAVASKSWAIAWDYGT
jgi:hypothetical protein